MSTTLNRAHKSRRVLVAGEGLARLATARALGRHGLDCRIVERHPGQSTVGRGPSRAILKPSSLT